MKKNKTIILSLILIMGVAFTACSRGVRGERTNLIRDGKTITVIEDSKDEQRKDELSLIGIEKHEDIRFMDWLDGDTILVTKDNTELGKIPVEDSKAYPKNLYYYSLDSEKIRKITSESYFHGFASFSPDKKHIFFKKHLEETAKGYIIDADGKNEIEITAREHYIGVYNGRWLDNESVIYSTISGDIFVADINKNLSEIEKPSTGYIYDVFKSQGKIYYITGERDLKVLDLRDMDDKSTSGDNTTLYSDVSRMFPSADNSKAALIKINEDGKLQLVVVDFEGSTQKVIAEGSDITGISWSPDQSMLAYCIMSENDAKSGIYISRLDSGKSSQVLANMEFVPDPIGWSPSGKKIAATQIDIVEGEYRNITYIIGIKD